MEENSLDTPKIKLLWWGHFLCTTGFGKVSHNVLKQLIKTGKYDITVLAINYYGEPYDQKEWPVKVIPALRFDKQHIEGYDDVNGRQRLLDEVAQGDYDIVTLYQDPFVVSGVMKELINLRKQMIKNSLKAFKTVYYYPVEGVLRENWVTDAIALADYPVAFCEYGKQETLKVNANLNVRVIPHGVDLETFKPTSEKQRQEYRETAMGGFLKGKYVVVNVNQNQWRKDLPRTLRVFKEFKKHVPEAVLYIHTMYNRNGNDLIRMLFDLDLELKKDVIFPFNLTEQGYPVEAMAAIYNMAHVVISTAHGEGWGFATTEAMACKVPVIMPDNTSLHDICGDGRGVLVKSGQDEDHWVNYGGQDLNIWRPTVHVDDMVEQMLKVYNDRINVNKMTENAYKWVSGFTWDAVGKMWDDLFLEVSKMVGEPIAVNKVGRNDPCPYGCGVKWKKCKVHNSEAVL